MRIKQPTTRRGRGRQWVGGPPPDTGPSAGRQVQPGKGSLSDWREESAIETHGRSNGQSGGSARVARTVTTPCWKPCPAQHASLQGVLGPRSQMCCSHIYGHNLICDPRPTCKPGCDICDCAAARGTRGGPGVQNLRPALGCEFWPRPLPLPMASSPPSSVSHRCNLVSNGANRVILILREGGEENPPMRSPTSKAYPVHFHLATQ